MLVDFWQNATYFNVANWRDIMIVQNAIQVIETGEVIASLSQHDFRQDRTGKYAVDGGLSYLRRVMEDDKGYVELSISDKAEIEERVEKTVWGTRGKSGKEPLKFVFLKDCETDHLEAILKINPNDNVKEVIEFLLKSRNEKRHVIPV